MFKITKIKVCYILLIILFCVLEVLIINNPIKTEISENFIIKKEINENQETINNIQSGIWQLEIPKINLKAEISEGTTEEVLNQYVGHFKETSKENGNIGLAAHNRGYPVNYFKDLKLLKEGDEILYRYNDFEKVYEVEKCRIIKDTDWEYLENTEENRLTLITCVENQPEYRRCIQAVEKEL